MKSKKLVLGIILGILLIGMLAVIIVLNLPEKEYSDKYLKEEKYSVSVQNEQNGYVDNSMAIYDDQGNKTNKSDVLSNEKFVFENKIGMYGFEVKSDIGESTLTYIIKNHSNEKQEKFKYRLQLINSNGSVAGTIDLESKEIPSLEKYKVTLEIDSDISNIYDIVPVTDFTEYGSLLIGGEHFED